ncbi:hypothetical protein M569_14889, partial [Genlisea aurea]
MSWFRSAVNKAVEVGNNNFTRTFKNYADSVAHHAGQAVAGGAKLFQDHTGGKIRSFKQTVKRLEEASVSCRGRERVELMKRWLSILRKFGEPSGIAPNINLQQHVEEPKEGPGRHSLVLYYDQDMVGRPRTFRDVFLYSQALEGLSICMILEPPSVDEVSLLLELYSLCLAGGKEVHNAILSSIQDLARVFSDYQDEVLVKREELLQFAEGAITGLKLNADIERIDTEVLAFKKQLDGIKLSRDLGGDDEEASTSLTIEALKEALKHIRLCSGVEGLLLKKKAVKYGDTAEIHLQKVDKLKVLSESLVNSSSKSEKRIVDSRQQKEDALKFRATKAGELGGIEKELAAEISELEKQKIELEVQLKKVNIALTSAQARLLTLTEERDQFFEANDQIVTHLKNKEDELSRSVGSCRAEVDVLSTWINFLEDTWSIQRSYAETKEKETSAELEKHEKYFADSVMELLSSYEKELRPSIGRIETYVNNLKRLSQGVSDDFETINPKKNLEEEYLEYEAKIITAFSVVDNMKEQF